MTRKQLAVWWLAGAVAVAAATLLAIAGVRILDLPPRDSVSLPVIVQWVERQDLGVIQSVEYEREWWQASGLWEVTACQEKCYKLYIDPRTGEERARKSDEREDELPAAGLQGPANIARHFEDGKLGSITEIEFEHGAWQVKFRERGLWPALQPSKRQVFQPARIS